MATPISPNLEARIVISDIPAGVIIGYDTKSLTFAENRKFQGLKEVPEGVHFLWAGSGYNSRRTGFWLITPYAGTVEDGHVIVKKWDVSLEGLVNEPTMAESRILRASINEHMDKLHSYYAAPVGNNASSDILSKFPTIWVDLTSCIKDTTLSHITRTSIWNNWHVSTTHEDKQEHDNQLEFSVSNRDEILDFIFPKDTKTFSREAIGRERTNQVMDSTTHITSIINNKCTSKDSDEIVGELQFCYITGMVLGNISCLEQWSHIVKLVFRAFQLTLDRPRFFTKFIEAIQSQFMYDGIGIDGSVFDHDNNLAQDLKLILAKFKSQINDLFKSQQVLTEDQKALAKTFDKFEQFLLKFRGGWDIRQNYLRSGRYQMEDGEFVDAEMTELQAEDERGEFAPAIVELDENGRETGLIRF